MTHSGSPAPEDFEGRLAALRAEFPGWTIECADISPLYRAVRSSGEGERLGAGSYSGLRRLLYEADTADCERALLALSKELEARGASAIRHSVSIVTRTRTGTARTVGASRRRFIWDSGLDLGPLDAVEEVALKITRLLGLELHPQLAALARRMGVRGYRVNIGAPEITVTADVGGTPRAVRITCEARPTDEDRDWFGTHWGDPIAEATDITGAEVRLVGLLTARP
ncbi:hypothetical protein [Actinomadura luteofluorescens]|uniref:hypothetical protein n=1 Tax=Actinomadura luteofluorescens TaxID=46163 RepID=UPI0030D0FB74